jgi:hypothetical protein
MSNRIQQSGLPRVFSFTLAAVILAGSVPAYGQEPRGEASDATSPQGFRIDSKVADQGTGAVIHANVTLICPSRTFDWSCDHPAEAVVIDFLQERMTLVNSGLKRCAYVTFAELVEFQKSVTERSAGTPLLKFAGRPEFTYRNWEANTKTISLQHPVWNYEAILTLEAPSDFVKQYQTSSDWLARLNTMRPGLPAGPRLELNREIASRQGLPIQVDLRREHLPGKKQILRSTHEYTWKLTPEDHDRILEIEQAIATSKPWSLIEHQRNRANNDALVGKNHP